VNGTVLAYPKKGAVIEVRIDDFKSTIDLAHRLAAAASSVPAARTAT